LSLRLALPLVFVAGLTACGGSGSASFRVVGVQQQAPADGIVLHVQVVNRTAKAMRLQRLEYTFAGSGHAVALERRQIEPGAAVVVEVPIDFDEPTLSRGTHGTLKGRLFAELDQMIQSFPVTAQVGEPGS